MPLDQYRASPSQGKRGESAQGEWVLSHHCRLPQGRLRKTGSTRFLLRPVEVAEVVIKRVLPGAGTLARFMEVDVPLVVGILRPSLGQRRAEGCLRNP